ncbi:MAG: DUF4178 domain-containing protein [Spirochaetes bacterium]|jgi:hypothetical protein|nr:DUF4178 domain-containing protein [Spirochaetota bacterium]
MADNQELKAIKCPACSGDLSRSFKAQYDSEEEETVQVPVAKCLSCGKEYDQHTQEYYELFADTFTSDKDSSVFKLGLKGKIDGVEYEIIGRMRYQDEEEWEKDTWDEWLAISAEGVYRYFVEEEGKVYSYEEYVPKSIDMAKADSIEFEGKKISKSSGYVGRIVFAEGELPWKPEIGEPATIYEFKKDGANYTIEQSEDEVSITRGDIIPYKKVMDAFGTEETKKKYQGNVSRKKVYYLKAKLYAAGTAVALCLAVYSCLSTEPVSGVMDKKQVLALNEMKFEENQNVYFSQMIVGPFDIKEKDCLYEVRVGIDEKVQKLNLEWQTFRLLLIDEGRLNKFTGGNLTRPVLKDLFDEIEASPEPVESFEVTGDFWDEEGYDDEGHWHESDLSGTADFVLDTAGKYYAYVELFSNKPRKVESVYVGVEKARSYIYFLITSALMAGLGYFNYMRGKSQVEVPFDIS